MRKEYSPEEINAHYNQYTMSERINHLIHEQSKHTDRLNVIYLFLFLIIVCLVSLTTIIFSGGVQ